MEIAEFGRCEDCAYLTREDGTKKEEWLRCKKLYVETSEGDELDGFGCSFFKQKEEGEEEEEPSKKVFKIVGSQTRYFEVEICAESEEEALSKYDNMGSDDMREVGELEWNLEDVEEKGGCDD